VVERVGARANPRQLEPQRHRVRDRVRGIGARIGILTARWGQMGVAFDTIGAAATMMALPMMVFLMLMQKQFVRGMTAGALKDA
jgi:ABC-type maltose transport system permease subunit